MTVTVHAGDGWPVADAALTLIDQAGAQVACVQADDQGALTAADLRPDTYTAIITAVGYEPVARTTLVPEGRAAALGAIELRQVGESELPAPGVWRIDPAHSSILVTAKHLG